MPLVFFGAWTLGISLGYARFDLSGMAQRRPSVWAAMMMTLVIITALTLGVTQLGAALPTARRLGNARWSLGAVFGIPALPLTNILSQFIGQLVLPLLS